jgi:hypothetical protein
VAVVVVMLLVVVNRDCNKESGWDIDGGGVLYGEVVMVVAIVKDCFGAIVLVKVNKWYYFDEGLSVFSLIAYEVLKKEEFVYAARPNFFLSSSSIATVLPSHAKSFQILSGSDISRAKAYQDNF